VTPVFDEQKREAIAEDDPELRLRQDIEEAIEQAANCLHDAKEWWSVEYSGPRTIDTLVGMIVVAAKAWKYKLDAMLADTGS
jgi:hypothetical protein